MVFQPKTYSVLLVSSSRKFAEAIRELLPVTDYWPVRSAGSEAEARRLATMLFIGQAGAAAVNAGKVYFTKNPMAINYPQWVAFAKYSYSQVKWALIEKRGMSEDEAHSYIERLAMEKRITKKAAAKTITEELALFY